MQFKYVIFLLALLIPQTVFSQQSENNIETEKSLKMQREEKLLYGINSEILDLIESLTEEKNPDFNKRLTEILSETKNRKVAENILNLFIETEYYDADETVYRFIEEKEYNSKNVVSKSIVYLSRTGKGKYNNDFISLLDSSDEIFRIEAVKALSVSGSKDFTAKLIEQYDKDESDRVRTEILLNIGELKDSSSVDFLLDILNDDYIDKTSKQYACHSLGLIGDDKAYPFLLRTYEDTDPFIRSYALEAISKFNRDDTEKIMLQALKDDSWQIRKQAAVSAAGMKKESFVPYLEYKAVNDPAKPVRTESVKALAEIASPESLKFLREKVSDKKASVELRKLSLIELINNDISGSRTVIIGILEDEWESKTPVLLETACSTLANKKSDNLEDFYSRMLDHPSLTIKLSGLKGIKTNKCSSLKSKVETFTADNVSSSSFKNYAKAVLEGL